jgi:cell division protein FtsI/penicillin-binding protein 2
VAFGHEVGVTLWQHAEALATVARGGLRRPLRLLTTVEQGTDAWQLELQAGRRVLSPRACDEVRAMMNLGATIGTGDKIAHPRLHPELAWIGTKTGTTEKVSTEMCMHVELPALAQHALDGTRMSAAERRSLATGRQHFGRRRATCYTSSMCAIGRLPDGRELLVLIVVDDPTGPEKFGSMVAGPTAIAVLRRALGLPRTHGEALTGGAPRSLDLTTASFSTSELPWADVGSGEPREGAR